MAIASKSASVKGRSGGVADFFGGAESVRRRVAIAGAGVLALGLGYHVVFGRNGLIVYEQKRTDAQTLDGELRSLSSENDRLKGHVDRLQSDPNAIEHEARNVLHYTRPGRGGGDAARGLREEVVPKARRPRVPRLRCASLRMNIYQ